MVRAAKLVVLMPRHPFVLVIMYFRPSLIVVHFFALLPSSEFQDRLFVLTYFLFSWKVCLTNPAYVGNRVLSRQLHEGRKERTETSLHDKSTSLGPTTPLVI